jgi:hypothetical protein
MAGRTFTIIDLGASGPFGKSPTWRGNRRSRSHQSWCRANRGRLAFGSTTGGLWLSEDQGDRWTSISHTLPPIHAVTFV